MANLNAAIRQVKRARQQTDGLQSENFDRYRPEYEEIFGATANLAGDPVFEELKDWMVESANNRAKLPTPNEVRRRARKLCAASDVVIPQDSPLHE